MKEKIRRLLLGLVFSLSLVCILFNTKVSAEELTKLATPEVTISSAGIATWNEVDNAVNYVYSINNVETETGDLSVALNPGDSVKVKALGDGVNYADSDYSESMKFKGLYLQYNADYSKLRLIAVIRSNEEGLADIKASFKLTLGTQEASVEISKVYTSVKANGEVLFPEHQDTYYAILVLTNISSYYGEGFGAQLVLNVNEETIEYEQRVVELDNLSKYEVVNGSFDNDLDGWTLEGEEFASVSENSTFWGEGYPMHNVGKYFDAYGKADLEPNQGTLTSSLFTIGGTGYITFMLGGAGNENCLIKVEDKDGNILAIYRNTEFRDFTAEHNSTLTVDQKRELIGSEVNLANLIKYKANLSAHIGKEVRVVIVDGASSGWGVIYFDELHTYHPNVPDNEYVEAINQLADLTEVKSLIANKITSQGDYTLDSYNEYVAKVSEAEAAITNPYIKQSVVDTLVDKINEAYDNLEVRISVKEHENEIIVMSGSDTTINFSDYFETDLDNVTYSYVSDLEFSGEDVLTLNTNGVEIGDYQVTLNALYNGEVNKTVKITVSIVEDPTPTLKETNIVIEQDENLYDDDLYSLDLASYINNPGNLELTYIVDEEELTGSVYTHAFDNVRTSINVKVIYANGELTFDIELYLFNSDIFKLANGDFETGDLTDWTVVGRIGDVSDNTNYWIGDGERAEGFAYGKDGDYLFDAYKINDEGAVGTLTSSTFIVGGSGYITYKIGAMRDGNYVYLDVVDAETKEILARYYNGLWAERTNDVKSGCTLIPYKADLSEFIGKEVFFRISDNADSGYGLFFADSFITYYTSEPEGFNDATPVNYEVSGTIYDVFNGGFEYGDNRGWWNNGEPGAVTGADAFFSGVAYGKVGNYLYSGVEDHGAGNGREGNQGTLTSPVFELGGNGYITYMLGGGNTLCYVQVIDSTTGEILGRYRQQARNDAVLVKYVADLSAYIGRTVRIQVVDKASSDWGCVSFDDVVTYYNAIPDGLAAIDIKYEIANGSFENGLDGWTMNITEAGTHNTLGWVESSEHAADWYTKNDVRKDGNNLFTFCKPDGTNCENTKGTLNSSTFVLKKDSYVSFRFGGAGTRDVHVQLVRADGTVIATFYNEAPGKINTEMFAYYYQYTGDVAECFFRVVDNSTANYGCFVVDDFRANLETAPEGFIAAIQ